MYLLYDVSFEVLGYRRDITPLHVQVLEFNTYSSKLYPPPPYCFTSYGFVDREGGKCIILSLCTEEIKVYSIIPND